MIGVVIQARMGSTRLYGKTMTMIEEQPLLYYSVQRAKRAKYINNVVVATTQSVEDDIIQKWCYENQVDYIRGSEDDVLDRYYQAAKTYGLDIIVRITSDCPFVDPNIIDMLSTLLINFNYDYISNRWRTRSWPHGLDVEVFTFKALEKAWLEAKSDHQREHVTPYILENPEIFKIREVPLERDLSHIRLTVDYVEDMEFVKAVMHKIIPKYGLNFTWQDVMCFLNENEEYLMINEKRCDIKLY